MEKVIGFGAGRCASCGAIGDSSTLWEDENGVQVCDDCLREASENGSCFIDNCSLPALTSYGYCRYHENES